MISLLLWVLCQHGSLAWNGQSPGQASTPRPNVLLFVLDDVGYQDVELVETPTLAGIAARGRRFRRGYAMPNCATARATLMFGAYLQSSGPTCFDVATADTPDTAAFSLPKVFEARRYETAIFGKWHLGTNRLGLPWQFTPQLHGYDGAFALVPGNVEASCAGFQGDYYRWLAVENGVSYVETRYQTLALRERFMDWWTYTRGPKFAVVSFQAAHAPFQEPPAELLPYEPDPAPGSHPNRAAYERLVITLDFVMSEMLALVDSRNTYVLVVGDNGTPPNATAARQDRDKVKNSVFEGGIHIPFLVQGPGIAPGDTDALASIADILPTLADLLGVPASPQDGRSLVPVLKDPRARVREHVFASLGSQRAVVQERYKLIRVRTHEVFYDLAADPREAQPLDPDLMDPEIVAALRRAMDHYVTRGV